MELRYYVRLLRRWWWLLLLAIVVCALPVYQYTQTQAKVYRAATTVFVNQSAAAGSITYSDALLNQQLVKTYSQMAEQPVVLTEVRNRLQLSDSVEHLEEMVSARALRDTQLFEIAVTGTDPVQLREIANTTAEVFIAQQTAYLPEDQVGRGLRVAQPALLPTTPIGPHPMRNALLAGLLGLLLAGGLVALVEYLDDTVKTAEDLAAAADLPTLGAVARYPRRERSKDGRLVSTVSGGGATEAYRIVRTNLDFASVERPLRTLLITSASPGEGKSTTAANLAVVLAQADRKVILVDADLRKPALHRHFGLANRIGLSSALLVEGPALPPYLQHTAVPGLRVMSSGPLPPNPAELLSSSRLRVLLERLVEEADIVLLDSPPALVVSDPIILASRADATLLVIDTGRTRAETVRTASETLARSGTRLLGGVLNKLARGADASYYYYHYAHYDGYTDNGPRDGGPPPPTDGRSILDRLRRRAPASPTAGESSLVPSSRDAGPTLGDEPAHGPAPQRPNRYLIRRVRQSPLRRRRSMYQ